MRHGLLFAVAAPLALHAQAPKVITLKPADAILAHEFSSLISVRELSNGRVLVADRDENRIVVGNFALNTVAQVGREGDGPGEYQQAQRLIALGGDSTVMNSNVAPPRQWILIVGSRMTDTLPQGMPTDGQTIPAWGADRNDFLLGVRSPVPTASSSSTSDSAYLVRYSRSLGRVLDTIARVFQLPQLKPGEASPVYRPSEFGLLALDGWVAVPRLSPYRVDWRSPQGKWKQGPTIPGGNPALDAREKADILSRHNGSVAMASWPATMPPFTSAYGHFITQDGKILIRRTPTIDHPWVYDLINRRGEREGQIEMPVDHRIVGFGAKSIYLAARGKDGIEYLERHPWP